LTLFRAHALAEKGVRHIDTSITPEKIWKLLRAT